jgi:NAD(P)-dependent dehydrogenase (short-subunit alcohol dehydrogenase family)
MVTLLAEATRPGILIVADHQEVVDAVLYLESASFVTSEVLHVDGGQHAGH